MPIHLLVPGLLDPWPESSLQQTPPAFPLLEGLLARAGQQAAPVGYPDTLFSLLGIPNQSSGDLPTAALCWLAETDQPKPENVLHADPVYLKPDLDNVQLFRPGNMNMEQAQLFAKAFNDFYKDYGFHLYPLTPDRWYVSVSRLLQTPQEGLDQVTGRNLRSFMTRDKQRRDWSRLFTEIQMLFHDLPVNLSRQARGELPVSGVWLSGGGELPSIGKHDIETVQGDDRLLQGLARYAGITQAEKLKSRSGNHIMVMQDCHDAWLAMDYPAWKDAVRQLEGLLEKWIKASNQIILYPCHGLAWDWRPWHRHRLWRRKNSLTYYLTKHNK